MTRIRITQADRDAKDFAQGTQDAVFHIDMFGVLAAMTLPDFELRHKACGASIAYTGGLASMLCGVDLAHAV